MFKNLRTIQNGSQFLIVLFLIGIASFSFSCKGPTGPAGSNGVSDKQIRIPLYGSLGTSDTSWNMNWSSQYITRFNLSNYVDLDSVIFCTNMVSYDSSADCIVELFDVTDSARIAGSLLLTNATGTVYTWPWFYSSNLINSFPDKEISLAVRMRSSKQGITAQVNAAVLLLYRK